MPLLQTFHPREVTIKAPSTPGDMEAPKVVGVAQAVGDTNHSNQRITSHKKIEVSLPYSSTGHCMPTNVNTGWFGGSGKQQSQPPPQIVYQQAAPPPKKSGMGIGSCVYIFPISPSIINIPVFLVC